MKIHLGENFFHSLSFKNLLLDTSVFIDSFQYPSQFSDFFNKCREENITLSTIEPVVVEFTKGFTSNEKLQTKKRYVETIVDTILPLKPQFFTEALPFLVQEYKEFGKDVSLTDFLLGAAVYTYRDLFLLTKNPKDFPGHVFTFYNSIVLEKPRTLQVYGVYSYKR